MPEKVLGMADLDVISPPDQLRTNLGSCVAVVLADRDSGRIGVAHVMLPEAASPDPKNPAKFADTAIPLLIKNMKSRGDRLSAKIAGGANMFAQVVKNDLMKIGERNIVKVKEILKELNIPIIADDVGGEKGRQLMVNSEDKKVYIRTIGAEMKEL